MAITRVGHKTLGSALVVTAVAVFVMFGSATFASSEGGNEPLPAAGEIAPTSAPVHRPASVVIPAGAAQAKTIALASRFVTTITGASTSTVVATVPASAGTTPNLPLIGVILSFSHKISFPAGLPILKVRREGDPVTALDNAIETSRSSVLIVDSVTVLVDLSQHRLFAIQPGGLAPQD